MWKDNNKQPSYIQKIDTTNNRKVFFISDPHYGHKNICSGVSKWNDSNKTRDFKSVEEMNEAIVKSINLVVGENDILYHLGDWSFGGWENVWHFRKQIRCKHIIHINGNHDKAIMEDKFFPLLQIKNGVIVEAETPRVWSGVKTDGDVTAHDFFDSVSDLVYVVIDGVFFVLSHEPFESWRHKKDGSIHLHGHVHHDMDRHILNTKYKRMDVGWNGKVYSSDDIIRKLSGRLSGFHHNDKKNVKNLIRSLCNWNIRRIFVTLFKNKQKTL